MRPLIQNLTLFSFFLFFSCKEKSPSHEEIIYEGNRQAINLVERTGEIALSKAESELITLLAEAPRLEDKFQYRRLAIFEDPKRLSVVVIGIRRDGIEVEAAVKKVITSHNLNSVELVEEKIISTDGISKLVYNAIEYRIVNGKLSSESIRSIKPGLMSQIKTYSKSQQSTP